MVTPTILFILEIIGTVAFAISGAFVAIKVKFDVFGVIVIGCITSVGGGLLRDILTETSPYIFRKHVYAVAEILGAILYYLIRIWVSNTIFPSIAAIIFVIGIRLLATKYCWSLPKIVQEEQNEKEIHT